MSSLLEFGRRALPYSPRGLDYSLIMKIGVSQVGGTEATRVRPTLALIFLNIEHVSAKLVAAARARPHAPLLLDCSALSLIDDASRQVSSDGLLLSSSSPVRCPLLLMPPLKNATNNESQRPMDEGVTSSNGAASCNLHQIISSLSESLHRLLLPVNADIQEHVWYFRGKCAKSQFFLNVNCIVTVSHCKLLVTQLL